MVMLGNDASVKIKTLQTNTLFILRTILVVE